jgi:hypothetical protein
MHCGRDIGGDRAFIADQQSHDIVGVGDQRTQ